MGPGGTTQPLRRGASGLNYGEGDMWRKSQTQQNLRKIRIPERNGRKALQDETGCSLNGKADVKKTSEKRTRGKKYREVRSANKGQRQKKSAEKRLKKSGKMRRANEKGRKPGQERVLPRHVPSSEVYNITAPKSCQMTRKGMRHQEGELIASSRRTPSSGKTRKRGTLGGTCN